MRERKLNGVTDSEEQLHAGSRPACASATTKCRFQRLFDALKRVAISLRTEYANDDGVKTFSRSNRTQTASAARLVIDVGLGGMHEPDTTEAPGLGAITGAKDLVPRDPTRQLAPGNRGLLSGRIQLQPCVLNLLIYLHGDRFEGSACEGAKDIKEYWAGKLFPLRQLTNDSKSEKAIVVAPTWDPTRAATKPAEKRGDSDKIN